MHYLTFNKELQQIKLIISMGIISNSVIQIFPPLPCINIAESCNSELV